MMCIYVCVRIDTHEGEKVLLGVGKGEAWWKVHGLLLNMDDCKVVAIEAQDDMALIESNIKVVKKNI
jgi:hypothetical protein